MLISNILKSLAFSFFAIVMAFVNIFAIDKTHIESLLTSSDFLAHEIAVKELITDSDVDTIAAIAILLNALEIEVTHPTSKARAVNTEYSITDFIQAKYIEGLIRMGNAAADSMLKSLAKTPSPLKDRFVVALGLMKRHEVFRLLGPLYYTSNEPFIRYKAIEALRAYRDTLAIPVFIDALKDDYYVIASGYVKDTVTTRHYLIKAEARMALKDLGYRFRYEGIESIPIPPGKEK